MLRTTMIAGCCLFILCAVALGQEHALIANDTIHFRCRFHTGTIMTPNHQYDIPITSKAAGDIRFIVDSVRDARVWWRGAASNYRVIKSTSGSASDAGKWTSFSTDMSGHPSDSTAREFFGSRGSFNCGGKSPYVPMYWLLPVEATQTTPESPWTEQRSDTSAMTGVEKLKTPETVFDPIVMNYTTSIAVQAVVDTLGKRCYRVSWSLEGIHVHAGFAYGARSAIVWDYSHDENGSSHGIAYYGVDDRMLVQLSGEGESQWAAQSEGRAGARTYESADQMQFVLERL